MTEVIQFPKAIYTIQNQVIQPPANGSDYLKVVKRFLTEEDYHDILIAILDEEHYQIIDPALKKIVCCYYTYR